MDLVNYIFQMVNYIIKERWNNNKKNGNGIQYYKNGNMQYQGLWLNGQKTYGKYYDNEGTILFNGLYQNLNNEMKEFIEKETKKDFFITSPIKK